MKIRLRKRSARSILGNHRDSYLEGWTISLHTCLGYEEMCILNGHAAICVRNNDCSFEISELPKSLGEGYTAKEESRRCTFSLLAAPISLFLCSEHGEYERQTLLHPPTPTRKITYQSTTRKYGVVSFLIRHRQIRQL